MGTTWRLGRESEARALWQHRLPIRRAAIDVKFIMELELQILRCRLHGLTAWDPQIAVYEQLFPKPTDPEYEEWYRNIEREFAHVVHVAIPPFLEELKGIKPSQLPSIGTEWGAATGAWWHERWPDHSTWALGEFVRFAKKALQRGNCVLATEFV